MPREVTIIDYGMSNLLSIARAVEHVGGKVIIAGNADEIVHSDCIILPGVGSFYDGMQELNSRGLTESIGDFIKSGNPFLGICLGMQMMLTKGTEIKECDGLAIVEGTVKHLPELDESGNRNTIPHVCWNKVHCFEDGKGIFDSVQNDSYMYFVHAYYADPYMEEHKYATTSFGDMDFTSVINKDNAWGTQFHPEKSGEAGLKILSNFIHL